MRSKKFIRQLNQSSIFGYRLDDSEVPVQCKMYSLIFYTLVLALVYCVGLTEIAVLVCCREEHTTGGRNGALSEGAESESQGAMSAQTAARLYEGQSAHLETVRQLPCHLAQS